MTTLKEEIAKQLKFNYLNGEENSYIEDAEQILKLFEKRIDEKLELIDKTRGYFYSGYYNGMESVKEMLK